MPKAKAAGAPRPSGRRSRKAKGGADDDTEVLRSMGWSTVDASQERLGAAAAPGRKSALPWMMRDLANDVDGVLEDPDEGGLFSLEVLDSSAVEIIKHENGAMEIRPRAAAGAGAASSSGDEPASAPAGKKRPRAQASRAEEPGADADADAGDAAADSDDEAPASAALDESPEAVSHRRTEKRRRQRQRKREKEAAAAAAARKAAKGDGEDDDEDDDGDASDDGEPAGPSPWELASKLPAAWKADGLEPHPLLAAGIVSFGFSQPTAVQAGVLAEACTHHRDVVAAAETGSGKTLAYAAPLLQRVLERRSQAGLAVEVMPKGKHARRFDGLVGLVLAPTRELAMQVAAHTKQLARHTCVAVAAIVGGMSLEKQRRLLDRRPDIIVATPGRLWDWVKQGHAHLASLNRLQVLVLDEADRMAGQASNEDLGGLLGLIAGSKKRHRETTDSVLVEMERQKAAAAAKKAAQRLAAATASGDAAATRAAAAEAEALDMKPLPLKPAWRHRQTMLFSATLGFAKGGDGASSRGKKRPPSQAAYLSSLIRAAGGEAALSKKQRKRLEAKARQMGDVDALLAATGVGSKPLVLRVARADEPAVAPLVRAAQSGDLELCPVGEDGSLAWGTAGHPIVEVLGNQEEGEDSDDDDDDDEDDDDEASQAVARRCGVAMVLLRGRAAVEAGGVSAAGEAAAKDGDAAAATESGVSAASEAAARQVAEAGASVTLPPGLSLRRMLCLSKDRDERLYWVLSLVTGRAIVFVNSIRAVAEVTNILTALGLSVEPVHAKMQQRQRLTHLDRFRAAPSGILVATDVAARGLDVPEVAAVIHYHVPRQADTFVHRSGRTARAGKSGLAVALVTPAEAPALDRILAAVRDTSGAPLLAVDSRYERRIAERVSLARRISKYQADANKTAVRQGWVDRLAADAGLAAGNADEEAVKGGLAGGAGEARRLKAQLTELLSKPLMPEGVSRKYLTAFAGMPGAMDKGTAARLDAGSGSAASVAGVAAVPSRPSMVLGRQAARATKRARDAAAAGEGGEESEDEEAFLSDDDAPLEWSDSEGSDDEGDAAPARSAAASRAVRSEPTSKRQRGPGRSAGRRPRSGGLVAVPVGDIRLPGQA